MTDRESRSPSTYITPSNDTHDVEGPSTPTDQAALNDAGYNFGLNFDDLLDADFSVPPHLDDDWSFSNNVRASPKRAYQPEEESTPFTPDCPSAKVCQPTYPGMENT